MRDIFYYWLGLGILVLNKIRYSIKGYHRPRTFSVADIHSAIEYDTMVVDRWEKHLKALYTPPYEGGDGGGLSVEPFKNAAVLELGSGADLGIGLILLARGASSYIALDKNRLLDATPDRLYVTLLSTLPVTQRARASHAWATSRHGQQFPLQFIHDPAFHLESLVAYPPPYEGGVRGGLSVAPSLIVSNAAFEHFDDVIDTLTRLTHIAANDARLCLTVDLQTHTRLIRDRDPLNIYRYSDALYKKLHFPGIPNRVRPNVYIETLTKLGWHDIQITPDIELPQGFRAHLDPAFQPRDSQMHILQFTLTAMFDKTS